MEKNSPKHKTASYTGGSSSNFLFKVLFIGCVLFGTMAFTWNYLEDTLVVNSEELANRSVSNTIPCGSSPQYGLYLNLHSGSKHFTISSGNFVEYADGTAHLTGHATNTADADWTFDIDVHFSGRTFTPVDGAPKLNECGTFNTSNWYYYQKTEGFLYGTNALEGAMLKLTKAGSPFQLGIGANVTDGGNVFDASGWLNIEILRHGTYNRILLTSGQNGQEGDFNFRLSGGALQSCMNVTDGGSIASPGPVCPNNNDPQIIQSVELPSGGNGALEYIWLRSTSGCPDNLSSVIAGATGATFDPGPITQTTWFRRCARRAGCDSWDFGESNCIKVEYFDECGNPTPEGWTLTCEDGQSAEILGAGIRCQDSYTFNIPNPGDVVRVIAEVVYKGTNANPTVLNIQTNNDNANVSAAYTNPARAFYFRTSFGPTSQVVLPHIPNSCQAQSLILYVFREGGQTTASTGRFVQTWLYHSTYCEVLEIPTAPATRDVEITVPLSEITTDGRIAIVRATVVDNPSITTEVIIDDINMGDALNISILTLQNVPALADEIEICVESPFATPSTPDGQSLVYSGGIKADPECKSCDDSNLSAEAEVISNYNGTQISCDGAADGRLQGLVSGGIPPFTYNWSNGATGQIISDIAPGTYSLTITDQFGCEATSSVTIDEPTPFSATIDITADYNGQNISCFGAADGAIAAIGSGGTAPYVYQWGVNGNFVNTPSLQNLAPGTYEVLISDANGCTDVASVTLTEPALLTGNTEVTSDYNGQDVSCHGANDGQANINVEGGTAPYIYNWSVGSSAAIANSLSAGEYTVTVTDVNGCQIIRTVTLTEPAPLTLDLAVTTAYNGFNVTCNGAADAAITSIATGGTGNLSYAWSNGDLSANISNVAAGNYSLTVTDVNGCTIAENINVTEPTELIIDASVISDYNGAEISCTDANDGRAEVMITGALAPYTINWSNGENTQIISDLAPGDYDVTVTDLNGCFKTATVTLAEPTPMSCAAEVTSSYFEGAVISTVGGSDGTALVNVTGGTGAYIYQWDDANFQTTATADNLSAGTYTVLVSDQNGCTCTSAVTLEEPAKVGNKIFLDANANGIQDAGEAGIDGVTLTLTGTSDSGQPVTRTAVTQNGGMYLFDGLLPGDYKITIAADPSYTLTNDNVGGSDAIDSDFSIINNMTPVFSLTAGEFNPTIDGGLFKKVTVGDYAWIDCDKNGLQDDGEAPLANVSITLSGVDGFNSPVLLTTNTDGNGFYEFENLIPGEYKLTFGIPTNPSGLIFSPMNIGDDALNSDVDPTSGMTAVFTLTSSIDNLDLDAGYIDNVKPVLNGVPADASVQCDEVPTVPTLYVDITATDNLDNEVEIIFTETSTQGNGDACSNYNYTITRTWLAKDDCGNEISATQIINIQDTEAPILIEVPNDTTVSCEDVPVVTDIQATDNCDVDITVEFVEDRQDNACLDNYTLFRTWKVVDDCGNETIERQTIYVIDETAPVLAGIPGDLTLECSEIPEAPVLYTDITATDNCDTEVFLTYAETRIDGDCPDSYQLIRTWTATDNCFNVDEKTQTITVQDLTPPTIAGIPVDFVIECDFIPAAAEPFVADNCDDDPTVVYNEVRINGNCENNYQLIRTWKVTDNCGNESTAQQTLTIQDTSDPVLYEVPADALVECDAIPAPANPYANDNCDDDVDILFEEERIDGDCADSYQLIRTWTATDNCGNQDVQKQTITVQDNTAPSLSGVPADITVACEEVPALATPTASDNCDGSVDIDFNEERIDGPCEDTYQLIRTWTATDNCGNVFSEAQNIQVRDLEQPILSGVPADLTVECDDVPSPANPTASDNCDAEVNIVYNENRLNGNCVDTYTLVRTWTATDNCGNQDIQIQTISVQDTTDPIMSETPGDITVECDDVPDAPQPYTDVTATDNCDAEVEIQFVETIVNGNCADNYSIVRTWLATDNCGNNISQTQTITVQDTQAPIISGVPADLTVECDQVPAAAEPTATDNCDTDVSLLFAETRVDGNCEENYQINRTWTATDNCGNQSVETQIITVQDTQAPLLSGVPANVTVECDEIPAAPQVSASDNCDANVEVSYGEVRIDGDCQDSYQLNRTWTATDNCGNQDIETQVITVQDTQSPVLSNIPADITVECDEVPTVDQITATDNCDVQVDIDFIENIEEGDCANNYTLTRTWTATDNCGNQSIESQKITVQDTQDPSLVGVPADLTVECNEVPAAPQVLATDNCDNQVEVVYTEVRIDGDCEDAYELKRTWTATDDCGNQDIATQSILVQDLTAPILTGVPANQTVECDEIPAAAEPTASDNCAAEVDILFAEVRIDGDCEYTYELQRTWTATDNCGNQTIETQSIFVEDNTDPILSGVPADVTVECDEIPAAANPTVSDNCDANVEINFEETRIDGPCPDSYTLQRTWSAADACGNATSETQVITVQDLMEPILSGIPADVTVECDEIPALANPTVSDNCDEDIDFVFAEVRIDGDCTDAYELKRTWTATDACGNQTSETQTIKVIDTTDPELLNIPANVIVECDEIPAPPAVEAIDNCDEQVDVLFAESILPGDCDDSYRIVRTWTATDNCGNQDVQTQTIRVVDTQDPVLSGVPGNLTVDCDDIPAVAQPTASDNCDAQLDILFAENIIEGDCPNSYQIERTWTATDNCGNQDIQTQLITVEDNAGPVLSGIPADVTVECDDIPGIAQPTAIDNCDDDIDIQFVDNRVDGNCEDNYELFRTWTATDACGNQTSETQKITVQDLTDPILSGVPGDVTVDCDEIPAAAQPTASDNCADEVDISFAETIVAGNCENNFTIIRTWTATDNCGNQTIEEQRLEVQDLSAPILDGIPADVTVECDAIPATAVVTATDDCNGEVTPEFIETIEAGNCPNNYIIIRTWTVADDCGNQSSETQRITVRDETDPILSGVPGNVTVNCDEIPAAAMPTATDNCTGEVTVALFEDFVAGNCEDSYQIIRTWTATDACGNQAQESQTITVSDEIAPTLNGVPADITISCADVDELPEPNVTGDDDCGNAVEVELTEAIGPGSCQNSYFLIRTWTATDACGNQSSASQEIAVIDETDPILSGVPNDVTVDCSSIPNVPFIGADITATDDCDINVNIAFEEEFIPGNCANNYQLIRSWTATDNCGNQDYQEQTITVIDEQAPELIGVPENIVVDCDGIPDDAPNVEAIDNCSNNVEVFFTEAVVPGDCENSFTLVRTWTATDECGNESSASQEITVGDNAAPILSAAPADITVDCNEVPEPVTITANDECTGELEIDFLENIEEGDCAGNYVITRTWTANDGCGNENSVSQKITVVDVEGPEIIGVPANASVSCGNEVDLSIPTVTAEDKCDENPTLDFDEVITPGQCANNYTIIRTWTAVDACGNETIATQFIEVGDNTDPILSGVPSDITIDCGEVPMAANVTADDSCDEEVNVQLFELTTELDCGFMVERTWTATDDCGNQSIEKQTITVVDESAPVLSAMPADLTINVLQGEVIPDAAVLTASDNCDDDINVVYEETIQPGQDCGSILIRTWTATDDCGNEVSHTQYINVLELTTEASSNSPVCQNGELELYANGGETYSWTGPNSFASNEQNPNLNLVTEAAAGIYQVIISNGNCSITESVAVEVLEGFSYDFSLNNADCGATGSIIIGVAGGTGNFTYDWTDLPGNDDPKNRENLLPGTYTIIISDDAGCSITIDNLLIQSECPCDASAGGITPEDAVVCLEDGTAILSATPQGNAVVPAGYSLVYVLTEGQDLIIQQVNIEPEFAVTASGNYTIHTLVYDANTLDLSIVVPGVTTGFDVNELLLQGGGEICASLDVPGANFNVQEVLFTIEEMAPEYCDTQNGYVSLTPANFDYEWNDGGTGAVRDDLAAGDYIVQATTPEGCVAKMEITIGNTCECAAPEISDVVVIEASCGLATGSATIIPVGDVSDYTYSWTPNQGVSIGAGNHREQLMAGIYYVLITEIGQPDCTTTIEVAIGNADGPGVESINTTPAVCSQANGTVELLPTNNQYLWALDGITANYRDDLPAGTYQVLVLDGNIPPCPDVITVIIDAENNLSIDQEIIAEPTCGESNGEVALLIGSGSGDYEITWSDGEITNDLTRNNLAGGAYQVSIEDLITGCIGTAEFILTNDVPAANVIITDMGNETCVGSDNGFVEYSLSPFPGFAEPANVSIVNAQNETFDQSNLPAGDYCIIVLDANGCFAGEACFSIEDANALDVDISVTNADCNNGGAIEVLVTGGTPGYTYNWADLAGANNPGSRNDLAQGTYELIITDANGCEVAVNNLEIEKDCEAGCVEPVIENVVVIEASCGLSNGSITIEMNGNNSDYDYAFSPASGNVEENKMTDLSAGVYEVLISNPEYSDCSISTIVIVENADGPVANVASITPALCGDNNGSAILSPATLQYEWCDGSTGATNNALAAGSCIVTITDPVSGCSSYLEIIIPENNELEASANILELPSCGNADGSVQLIVDGGSGSYTFSWVDGSTGAIQDNLAAGVYEVGINDLETGCSTALSFAIDEQASGEVTISVYNAVDGILTLDCAGSQNGLLDFDFDMGPGFIFPSQVSMTGAQGGLYNNGSLTEGNYCLAIADAEGCQAASYCFEVVAPDQIDLDVAITAADCDAAGSIELMIEGGQAPYTIDWIDLAGTDDPQNRTDLAAGIYGVTVYDANGCQSVATNLMVADDCSPCSEMEIVNIILPTNAQDESCVMIEGCLEGNITYTLAGGMMNGDSDFGSWVLNEEGCLIYNSNMEIGLEVDEICVIASNGTETDTTCYIFSIFELPLNQPMNDTIYVSTPIGTPLEDCINVDEIGGLVTGNTISFNSSVGGSFSLEDKCFVYVPNPDISGMFIDTVEVVLCNELIPACDTTTIIISIMPDVSGCQDIFTENDPVLLLAEDCTEGVAYCVEFEDVDISNLQLMNNNSPVGLSFGSCGNFGGIINFATGPNQLVVMDTGTGCTDTLMIQVNCDDCPVYYEGPEVLTDVDCAVGGAVCLNFEIADLFDYTILDNGEEYTGIYDICTADTSYQYVAFQLGSPSSFKLESWIVNGQEFTLDLFTTAQQLADSMNVWDPAGDWQVFGFVIVGGAEDGDYGDLIISTTTLPPFNVPAQIIPDATSIFLSEGAHEIEVINDIDGCSETFSVLVECSMINIVPDTSIVINEGEIETFCFDLPVVTSIVNLCEEESNGNADYSILAGTNCIDISGLQLGDDNFCFIACDAGSGLCDTLNLMVTVVPVTDTITEIINLGFFDTLCLNTNIFQGGDLTISNICANPNNLNVDFNLLDDEICVEYMADQVGQDTACLVVCDSLGFCDTTILIVEVIIPQIDTVNLEVMLEAIDTFCIDLTELQGPVDTFFNYCPEASGEFVNITLDEVNTCIIYEGLSPGIDTACIVVCDTFGICDTTIFFIETTVDLAPIAVNDTTSTTLGTGIIIDILGNDTLNGQLTGLNILSQPANGTAIVNPDGSITYTPNIEFCGAIDSFQYVITTASGSDTATVFIDVQCQDLVIFSGFSPNNDDVNDVFNILGIEQFPDNEVCIFNRWGNRVFQEKGYTNQSGWDGTFKGDALPDGTYFYVIDDGTGRTFSGYLQIHR